MKEYQKPKLDEEVVILEDIIAVSNGNILGEIGNEGEVFPHEG